MSEVGVGLDVGSDGVVLVRDGAAALLDVTVSPELSGRVGDHVPLVVLDDADHHVVHGHELFAGIVEDALATAAVPTPDPVTSPVAVAVPGWWTTRALALVGRSLAQRGLGSVVLVHDAEAAVLGHRAAGFALPSTVMVVDLGAQSCSAAIVEDCDLTPRAVGSPGSVHLEGGNDLDALVLHHVLDSLAELGTRLEHTDPEHVSAARDFLAECRRLREDLSGSSVVTVAPSLPGEARRLRVVREELEALAEPWLEGVLRLVGGCLEHHRGDVDAVLLVGGLARTPLVARAISAELDLDVVVDDDPRTTSARGAATLAVPAAVPPERRRSRLRRPERSERRRTRRALGPAARDELVALPAAPSVPQVEVGLPPAVPRFEAPAPVEDGPLQDAPVEESPVRESPVDETPDPGPVVAEVVAEDVVEGTDGPHPEADGTDVVDAELVESGQSPQDEVLPTVVEEPAQVRASGPTVDDRDVDPDIEDALTEQAVVEAEVEAEPAPRPAPEVAVQEPEPQVLAPEPTPVAEEHVPEVVPAPVAAKDEPTPVAVKDEPVEDAVAAPAEPPVEEPTPPALEIAGEAPPIGARVRRSARLLDAALGASALDTGRFLVDGPAPAADVRRDDVAGAGTGEDEAPADVTTTEESPVAEADEPAAEAAPHDAPVEERAADAPGTDLALIEPDEPTPARVPPPEPEPQGLAARLRRRRQERRARRGKAPEPTAAEQITAADAVRALRATLDRPDEVDHGDAGAPGDDGGETPPLDLTPVPWARAAELQERLRLAEAGLLDADTLMDLSVLSGGRS